MAELEIHHEGAEEKHDPMGQRVGIMAAVVSKQPTTTCALGSSIIGFGMFRTFGKNIARALVDGSFFGRQNGFAVRNHHTIGCGPGIRVEFDLGPAGFIE